MTRRMQEQDLENQLRAYLQSERYTPQDVSSIARGMGIPSSQRASLRQLLRQWESEGIAMRLRQSRYALRPSHAAPMTGHVRLLPHGKMIFIPDREGQKQLLPLIETETGTIELPIRRHQTGRAMDGDKVHATIQNAAKASIRHQRRRSGARNLRLSARIDRILERKRKEWIGIYRKGGRYGYLEGDGRNCPEKAHLTAPPPPEWEEGMVALVTPESYAVGKMEATGRPSALLGRAEDPETVTSILIHKHNLPVQFPAEALQEAAGLPEGIAEEEEAKREDWRARTIVTIDPTDARDYDDAISLQRQGGGWELAVHIADVSHYVRPGSALDREAQKRGNSTYLPDRVIPMLPPRLSDDLCSLRQGHDRLTFMCLMRLNPEGDILRSDFRKAVIRSSKRLDYATTLAILEKKESSGNTEIDGMLQQGHILATLLRQKRMERGALDLETPEIRVLTDDRGRPTGIESERSDIAHQMIEEFMLLANEQAAIRLKKSHHPAIYRIHEEPEAAKLQEFSQLAAAYGIPAGSLSSRDELKSVMNRIKESPDEMILTTALLKAMMRARYCPQALGHFGLAKNDYTHFTSPIRRYADLLVHRILSCTEGKEKHPLPTAAQMEEAADHLSETERTSAAAEQEARKQSLLYYLEQQTTEKRPQIWEAIVTDTWTQGLFIEIPLLQLRGLVPADGLASSGNWFYERHASRWATFDGRSLQAGSKLNVIPKRVDRAGGMVDFSPAS